MITRVLGGIVSLLCVTAVLAQTPAPPESPQGQCPSVFVKLHEDLSHSLVMVEGCLMQKGPTPECHALQQQLRRLIAEREQLCRDNQMSQGVYGCP